MAWNDRKLSMPYLFHQAMSRVKTESLVVKISTISGDKTEDDCSEN